MTWRVKVGIGVMVVGTLHFPLVQQACRLVSTLAQIRDQLRDSSMFNGSEAARIIDEILADMQTKGDTT